MTDKLPVRALLEIEVDPTKWSIPQEYEEALKPYLDSVPTVFHLPWPTEFLLEPTERKIFLDGLPVRSDTVEVENIEYAYSSSGGYTAYLKTKGIFTGQETFDLHCLLCFSSEGFLVENQSKTIKEILNAAGLRSTPSEP